MAVLPGAESDRAIATGMESELTHRRCRPRCRARAQTTAVRWLMRITLGSGKKIGRSALSHAVARARSEQAERMDRWLRKGRPLPPLAGVPVGIKDVMVTRGVRTTAGSKILDKYHPSL